MINVNSTRKIYASITSIGGYVPKERRTNEDLSMVSDTSDEWIVKRTGIKERRILEEGRGTSDMAVEAIKNLFDNYNKKIEDVEVLIIATSTPDMLMPSTANIVCKKLNLSNILAFDINAACSGFLYAFNTAASLIESGRFKNVLVVGADKISAYVDIADRSTNILFGDGAAAVLLEPTEEPGLVDSVLKGNGEGKEFLNIEGGGSLFPGSKADVDKFYIKQDGKIVFKNAITAMSDACLELLEKNNLTVKDINWLIPHQANKRIIDAVGASINIDEEKTLVNIENYGNTIAATIPLCMWENVYKFKKGDYILLTAFGAGFSWGATLIKWNL